MLKSSSSDVGNFTLNLIMDKILHCKFPKIIGGSFKNLIDFDQKNF